MIAIPVYKCRLCGNVHNASSGVSTSNKLLLSLEMMSDFNKTNSIQIHGRGYPGYNTHECADGSIGISELIGVRFEGD